MPTGTVKWFNIEKGFGFVKADDSDVDIFVHVSALKSAGLSSLRDGQRISFVASDGKNGRKQATQIRALAEPDRVQRREETYSRPRRDPFEENYERRLSRASGKTDIERIQDEYFSEIRKWK